MINAYPLCWPPGFPRTQRRIGGAFKTSLSGALSNVRKSVGAFATDSGKKIDGMVISSNCSLGDERPSDPGVAVWFTWDGIQVCIPVDRYEKVEANLQAIHHILEARRTELRHGGLAIVRATFTGFKALPAPAGRSRGWREVLGFESETPRPELLRERYLSRRSAFHPDKGGTTEEFNAVQVAYEQACAELRV